jgi:hypothetical protein
MDKIKIDRQNNQMSEMAGEICTNIDISQFAMMLINNGIRTKLGNSSVYIGGTYIRIEEGATEFSLENIGEEYLATGHASSCDRMYQTAKKISDVLIMLDINHAFEIYNGSTEIVYYLHHNLPQ